MPALSGGEARRRFAVARVARLATADDRAVPHLVPVTFAVVGGEVLTAVDRKPKTTHRLRRLANIAVNPAVCLLVDRYDEDWERLWWVRADGTARLAEPGTAAHQAGVAALAERYPQYRVDPPDGPLVAVSVDRWTGWSAT